MLKIAPLLLLIVSGFGQDSSNDASREYRKELERNPRNSLAHFRTGELYFKQHNFQAAANEFREALNGDAHPQWIDAWAHIDLGELFDETNQRERAVREYWLAIRTNDDTDGAQTLAAQRLGKNVEDDDIRLHQVQGRSIRAPEPIVKVAAEYSQEAQVAELEGTVKLAATIALDGSVRELRVVEPLGAGLDEAAKAAANRWSFKPGATSEGSVSMATTIELSFLLPSKQSRWHLLRAAFSAPEGASRPRFTNTSYPAGDGIGPEAAEDAHLLAAIGRPALVTLSFDVDQGGHPVRFHIERSSGPVWGHEAISVVRRWRFFPARKNGSLLSVPCTLDLLWGERKLTEGALLKAREAFEFAAIQRQK
ncbi:MAG TPA: TonB family protein [Bryobacteraceae bacterium]|jgi:TonB family protein